jgi:CheY-like chemotaxis protein
MPTRQLVAQTEELFQQARARREREAEQHARAATPPGAGGILLIEDNPADVRLFSEALAQNGFPWPLTVLTCQNEVGDFVQQDAAAQPAPPQLIILDSRIPGMEAAEILAALRSRPAYANRPALLFSSLDEVEGQRRSAELGATAFVRKPGDLEAFFAAVATMVRRWGWAGDGLATDPGYEGVRQEGSGREESGS